MTTAAALTLGLAGVATAEVENLDPMIETRILQINPNADLSQLTEDQVLTIESTLASGDSGAQKNRVIEGIARSLGEVPASKTAGGTLVIRYPMTDRVGDNSTEVPTTVANAVRAVDPDVDLSQLTWEQVSTIESSFHSSDSTAQRNAIIESIVLDLKG